MPLLRISWRVIALVAGVILAVNAALLMSATPGPSRPLPTITPQPSPVAGVDAVRAQSTAAAEPTQPLPTAPPTPVWTPTSTGPTAIPTPSPRPAGTPWRVGLQVGHWKSNELPEELARLRTSTGAYYGGIDEAELNLDIAQRVKPLLEAQGVIVDLLPATVPPSYDADAFIAIHADGSSGERVRGWKVATPWRTSPASQQLRDAMAASYSQATGLPEDLNGITFNMRGYYAFSYRRHTHAIARTTPAIILEMGFLTNASDRDVMFRQADRVAQGIADGVMNYLRARDPLDGAALLPPEFPVLRAIPSGALLRAAPRDDARVLAEVDPEQRIIPFRLRDGWYEVVVRGEWRIVGWIRADQVEATNEQPSLPTPTNP